MRLTTLREKIDSLKILLAYEFVRTYIKIITSGRENKCIPLYNNLLSKNDNKLAFSSFQLQRTMQ